MSEQAQDETQAAAPRRVAVFTPHPDDAEIICGGTMARWAAEGHEITLVLLTGGNNGSDDPEMTHDRLAATREQEQLAASAILGVKETIFLRYPDSTLVADMNLRRHLVRVVREIKPHVVITMDPSRFWENPGYINHPDHRATGEATLAAVYPAARNRLTFLELADEGVAPWVVEEVYISSSANADLAVDITDYIDVKIAALNAHASQISEWEVDKFMREWGRYTASQFPKSGEYAEGFKYLKIG
ncbi:MAG: PIG-L family deacetylase [Chloroflexota bacterium]|nr:PIG-L family deacetylase [Chloroflexota bacterium]